MNKEEKIYFLKNIPLGKKTIFRDLEIVLRKTDWWSSRKSFAIWWRGMKGVGIIGKKDKQFKYFMVGLDIYDLKFWVNITYIGNKKKDGQK